MLLRRFYIQENEKGKLVPDRSLSLSLSLSLSFLFLSPFFFFFFFCSRLLAPKPRPKKNRELNTKFEGEVESFGYTA